jgi:hypothetical protein
MHDFYQEKNAHLLSIFKRLLFSMNNQAPRQDSRVDFEYQVSLVKDELHSKLSLDDKKLYLHLLKSNDLYKSKLTTNYLREMTKLGEIIEDFTEKFKTNSEVKEHSEEFYKFTKNIAEYLEYRISSGTSDSFNNDYFIH